MEKNKNPEFSNFSSDKSKNSENQLDKRVQKERKTPRSLLFGVKSIKEVTGRHQRGFDGEGSEGT